MAPLCQEETRAPQQNADLFDHLVGTGEQRCGQIESERPGGLKVNKHLEFGWLLNWKIGGFCTLENLVDVVSGAPHQISETCSVGDETSGVYEFSNSIEARQSLLGREFRNARSARNSER